VGPTPVPEEDPVADQPDKPAEASLYDDPETADLAAKVNEAWSEFGRALGAALQSLPSGATLELTLDPTASGIGEAVYSVSVAPAEDKGLQAHAIGNSLLPPEHRLSRTAVGELVALGWSPPGVLEGGDERFGLQLPKEQATRLAAIVSRTLRDVYGTPHPAFLVYAAQTTDAAVIDLPNLGAARPHGNGSITGVPGQVDMSALPLPEKVAAVIAAMLKTTPEKLPVDKDGDIGIRSGSAMVFVRTRDNPPLIDVFSPVLTGVDANEQLYVRLSELTHRMPIGRLYCANETVWASVPVFGREFQPTHLMLAVQVMTGLADELDDRLHGEFGGKRFFVESDIPAVEADAEGRTGMYL
jgi:hypothetical protein